MYIEKNSCFIPQREEKMSEKTLAVLNDAAIRFDGRRLTMENNLVSRTIDFFRGYPETVSFRRIDLDREFADPEEPGCGVSFSGITPPGMYDVAFQLEGVTAKSVPAGWAETAHLEAEVTMYEPVQQVRFRVTYFLYPGVPAVGVQAAILSRVMPNLYWSYRREMRSANDFLPVEQSSGAVDGFRLAPGFAPECSLEPVARTDVHDDLLLDHPALPGEEFFRGNLLWCRNRAGAGVLVLQESSPSGERRDWAEFDFMVRDRRLRSCAWNAAPWELSPEVEIESGRSVTILAADEVERDCRLKDYLRGRFPTAPETHVAMVNPWGCGRFRELVGEEFLRREIEATAACGAECYQIDDTWQQGEGLGRLINVNEHLTPAFWKISETRLRGTFAGLLPIAAQSKVELALWCAPSSNVEFRDWEAFREFLLDFHRRWNFRFFKIDGVKIRTCEAERNLETLLRSVREATGGRVYFNLDTTAGQRPGYFRMVEYGNIFLEAAGAGDASAAAAGGDSEPVGHPPLLLRGERDVAAGPLSGRILGGDCALRQSVALVCAVDGAGGDPQPDPAAAGAVAAQLRHDSGRRNLSGRQGAGREGADRTGFHRRLADRLPGAGGAGGGGIRSHALPRSGGSALASGRGGGERRTGSGRRCSAVAGVPALRALPARPLIWFFADSDKLV